MARKSLNGPKRHHLPKDLPTHQGEPGYPFGRCQARSKTQMRRYPEGTREEQRCLQPCVEDFPVCHFHGANPNNRGGRPPVTGFYSKYVRGEIAARIEEFRADDKWADLRDELSLLRGLLTSYLELNMSSVESEDSLKSVGQMTLLISQLVEKLHNIEYGKKYSVSVNALQAYAVRIGDLINQYVEDEDARSKLSDELLALFQTDRHTTVAAAVVIEDDEDAED